MLAHFAEQFWQADIPMSAWYVVMQRGIMGQMGRPQAHQTDLDDFLCYRV
jgi:hypothetical protein